MSKSLASLDPSTHIKIMVLGDYGNGKTVFASSFPGPIHFEDFDGKIGSAASHLKRTNPSKLSEIHFEDYAAMGADCRKKLATFNGNLTGFEKEAAEGRLSIKTYVLDSLTTFSNAMLDEVVRQNPGIKSATPGQPSPAHYGVFGRQVKNMLGRVLALPCNVVILAHMKYEKDETTGRILAQVVADGQQLSAWLPIVLFEVYRAYAKVDEKGNTTYWAQTRPDGQFNCRSQISGLPAVIPLDYAELIKPRS